MSNPAIQLFQEIEKSLDVGSICGSTRVITIDGRAGSGKTTLASDLRLYLSGKKRVEVIHLDEIYSGWKDALSQTLTIDLQAITESLGKCQPVTLQIYNWHEERYDSTRSINPPDVLIIEGVGSGQSAIRDDVAVTIWMEISPEFGLARVLERDGVEISQEMQEWQGLEESHFEIEKTQAAADFVLSTNQ